MVRTRTLRNIVIVILARVATAAASCPGKIIYRNGDEIRVAPATYRYEVVDLSTLPGGDGHCH